METHQTPTEIMETMKTRQNPFGNHEKPTETNGTHPWELMVSVPQMSNLRNYRQFWSEGAADPPPNP